MRCEYIPFLSHRCILVNSFKHVKTCCLVLNAFSFPFLIAIFYIVKVSGGPLLTETFSAHTKACNLTALSFFQIVYQWLLLKRCNAMNIYLRLPWADGLDSAHRVLFCYNKWHVLGKRSLNQTFTYQFPIGFLCTFNCNSSHLTFRCLDYLYEHSLLLMILKQLTNQMLLEK